MRRRLKSKCKTSTCPIERIYTWLLNDLSQKLLREYPYREEIAGQFKHRIVECSLAKGVCIEILLAFHHSLQIVGVPNSCLLVVRIETPCVERAICEISKPLTRFLSALVLTLDIQLTVLVPCLVWTMIDFLVKRI